MNSKKNTAPIQHISKPDRVFSYFRVEKWVLLIVTISGIIYNIGLLAGPWFEGMLAQFLFDTFEGSRTLSDMLTLAAAYVAVTVLVQLMRYIKRFYVRRFANNVNRNMKHVLYYNLIHMSKAELERESTGSMMTKAVSDVDACAEGMRKFTTEVFDTGIALLSYIVMLFVYDWRLAILSCVFPPFAYFIAEKMKTVVHRCTARFRESAGRLNSATIDRVSGAITYRVFGCEEQRDSHYQEYLEDYEKSAVKANIWVAAMPPVYQVISMASSIFIIYFGSKNVLNNGWTSWDIAAFTTFLSCFIKLAIKSSKAAKLFNAVQQAQISWGRIMPLMCETKKEKSIAEQKPSVLEVSQLDFKYQEDTPILENISFSAFPGQIIGITGPVACGKSTLGKIFLGEAPYGGSIRFNGIELSEMPSEVLRGIVGYMGHEAELLSDTIEQNILLGDSEDAREYLKAVDMDAEVAEMTLGLRTPVGNSGVRLSGGQQARLALARTLCHKKPVMVLDDPFSAVDRITEAEIFSHLRTLAQDSVVLLISHRLYLFPQMNQVIWMENGGAVVDTHDELMRSNERYKNLYLTQSRGGESDGAAQ